MSIAITSRSRLRFSSVVNVAKREFWDMTVLPPIDPQDDDLTYQWDQLDTIEAIANQFYGDSALWWVIAYRNQLIDMPGEIRTGDKILIPSRRYVFDVFLKKTTTPFG